jgi:hypothetical protein
MAGMGKKAIFGVNINQQHPYGQPDSAMGSNANPK